jgi:hypothetical protein
MPSWQTKSNADVPFQELFQNGERAPNHERRHDDGSGADPSAVRCSADSRGRLSLHGSRLLAQRQRFQHRLLFCDELLHALLGYGQHLGQLLVVEDLVLGGGLDFD